MERVAIHTESGDPDHCWGWNASRLPSGRPRLSARLPGGGRRTTSFTVARIIAAHREGLDLFSEKRWVARHSCDNLECVNPAHILSGSYGDNMADMLRRGRAALGNRNPRTKLTPSDVRAIRARLASGDTQSSIGADYHVTQGAVGMIARGATWSWLE